MCMPVFWKKKYVKDIITEKKNLNTIVAFTEAKR